MTRNKIHALVLAAAAVLCGALLAVSAQSAPLPVPQSQKIIKERFEVVQMSFQLLQVRSLDMREHFTFSYSPGIRDKMQNIFNAGGYQYGDKVKLEYDPQSLRVVKFKGKPSKPL